MYDTLIDVAALAHTGDAVVILDCRADAPGLTGEEAFLAGHLPGATYFHLEKDFSGLPSAEGGRHPLPDRTAFADRSRRAGVSAGTQVVAYDDAGGPYAARAWWMLRWLGHRAVAVLDGGLQAWTAAGHPLESGPARGKAAGDIQPSEPIVRTAETDEIVAALGSNRLLVIDARSEDRFGGAPHPLDTVSGHIPGARNRFYQRNLDANGRFKSASQLAQEFGTIVGDTPIDQVVLQCGSGVTACHDLLGMEIAGLNGARLYVGSWSAWTSDPARPIAR